MYEHSPHIIRTYLQKEDVQERIRQNIQRGRLEATVTIGRAARLFGFTENQLRDWENRGLLKPIRTTSQRQYPPAELDKLAIIKELIDEGGFTPGSISSDVDEIWNTIVSEQNDQSLRDRRNEVNHLPINLRIENVRAELFWRYYASRALRLSLMLICDELPNSPAGLVLPIQPDPVGSVDSVKDLAKLGPSLIGWLSKTRSSHTLFTLVPSFQYSTDHSLLPLAPMEDDRPLSQPKDKTFIVLERLDRRSNKTLSLTAEEVETIRMLLAPIYENAQTLHSIFGLGLRDEADPAPNLDGSTAPDEILNGLADIVIRLGGYTNKGADCWRFCCILLPKDSSLPLQQHTLVVRAQSKHSPHKIGGTTVSPDKFINALSLRAYQSGDVIYRPKVTDNDTSIAFHQVEGPIRSALAIPIGWESGSVGAVLYIVSYEIDAFSDSHLYVLRLICRMIEEAIVTYSVRHQIASHLTNALDRPRSADPLFEDFLSENDFVSDVDSLLTALKTQIAEWKEPKYEKVPLEVRKERFREQQATGEVVSFIAVDVDNQSSLAVKYGDQVARNLSKEVGSRIKGQQLFFTNPDHRRLYHICADRFYLLLKGIALDEARNKAEQLRVALQGNYRVEARRVSTERLMLPEGKLELQGVTVRLGVASYPYRKLEELLQRHPTETDVAGVRAQIMRDLDEILNVGQQDGGNVIASWDIESWGYILWRLKN
jgi:DNA-binding transcriptional MerR regulator/GGDEF domain-containing protein